MPYRMWHKLTSWMVQKTLQKFPKYAIPYQGNLFMPIISRFFGILIFMFWREHRPAHFHAKYGDDEIVVEIESGKISGTMTKRALAYVFTC